MNQSSVYMHVKAGPSCRLLVTDRCDSNDIHVVTRSYLYSLNRLRIEMAKHLYFEGATAAARYAATRPTMCAEISRTLLGFLEKGLKRPFNLAIDVGCGSGQYTESLAPEFKKVIGLDASETQIKCARDCNSADNVEYGISPAESLPLETGTVDLVFASTAAHWFDYPNFCKEVDRVLRPAGSLVVMGCVEENFSHDSATISAKLKQSHEQLIEDEDQLGPYWPMSRTDMRAFYDNLTMLNYPEQERRSDLVVKKTVNVDEYIEYCKTTAGSFVYLQQYPHAVLFEKRKEQILNILGCKESVKKADMKFTIEWPVRMMLARKPHEEAK